MDVSFILKKVKESSVMRY